MSGPAVPVGSSVGPVVAETTRRLVGDADDGLVESVHRGHLAVTDEAGTVIASLGDPRVQSFVRSAAKPFQAAACVEVAALEVPPDQLAVAWSSHRGEPAHLEAVQGLLSRAGLGPDDLTTPVATRDDTPRPPTRLGYNCSGKHALFALAGRTLGVRGPDLLDPDGPLQRRVLDVLHRELGPGPVAVDGCGAPAVAATLDRLAAAFARLAGATDGPAAAVVAAGHAHPLLVGGTGRLETALLGAGVVAKPGAEGIFAAGWTRRDAAYGVALKIEDGAHRAASVTLHALLVAAGAVDADVWSSPPVLGGGRAAGTVRATAAVEEVGAAVAGSKHR